METGSTGCGSTICSHAQELFVPDTSSCGRLCSQKVALMAAIWLHGRDLMIERGESMNRKKHGFFFLILFLLSGCASASKQEQLLSQRHEQLAPLYEGSVQPPVSGLEASSTLKGYLTRGLVYSPAVRTAYFDWVSSVEAIVPARSLDDPLLTFSVDIQNMVMSFMPDLMQPIPGPGKLELRGRVATHESQATFFALQNALLQTAFGIKRLYYELAYLEKQIETTGGLLLLQQEREALILAQNQVNSSRFFDVIDFDTERETLRTTLKNLQSSLTLLRAQWKAALGFLPNENDPPYPTVFEYESPPVSFDEILTTALQRNPRLQMARSMIQAAHDRVALAYKTQIPDFVTGLGVEIPTQKSQSTPTWKPQMGLTLPIWRKKIAAEIAQSMANEASTVSALSQEEIALAVAFVEATVMYEIAAHNTDLLTTQALPNVERNLALLRAQNAVALSGFLDMLQIKKMVLNLQLDIVGEKRTQQIQLAALSLLIAGNLPSTTTVLDTIGDSCS